MRKYVGFFVLSLFMFVFAGYASAAYKAEYKLTSNVAPTAAHGVATGYFVDLVKERTNGEINIKAYYGASLTGGKPSNEFSLIRGGAIDFAHSSFINYAPQFPEGNLFLLPWFISGEPDKYKALDAIEAGKTGKMIEEKMAKKGLVIIGWGENGYREITNSVRPIRVPADLKDLKIRTVGSKLFLDIFSALGANPTNMNFGEMLTALQQGVIDGEENPIISSIIAYKIYESQKYVTVWSYNVDPFVFVVNKKIWDSFTPEIQKILQECAEEAGLYNKALCRVGLDNGESLEYFKEKGMPAPEVMDQYKYLRDNGCEVEVLTAEEINEFKKLTAPVVEEWTSIIGKDLVEAAKEDMQSVRE